MKIPIIGCGGIMNATDVVEYMLAGASAVEIGFLSFRNPTGMIAVMEDLAKWCDEHGVKKVSELTGGMLPHPKRDTYQAGMIGIT